VSAPQPPAPSAVSRAATLPPELRAAVAADLAPVVPLWTPWARALVLALPAAAAVGSLAASRSSSLGLRGVGGSVLLWGGGLVLTALALRAAIPGRGMAGGRAMSAMGLSASAFVAFACGVTAISGAGWMGPGTCEHAFLCGSWIAAVALPPALIGGFLLLRARPLRPAVPAALLGAASALFGVSAWHLMCGRADLAHVALGHGGPIVVLALAGAAAGWGIARLDERRRAA
jgi:hypothetical protein